MKKWLLILLPLIVLVGLIGWRFHQKGLEMADQTGQQSKRMNAPASVELVSAQVRDIINTFEATGNVESIQNVQISPKIIGRIEYLQVREGDHVKQGQVLARLDRTQLEADVRAQRANLAEAKYRLAQAQLTQTTTDSSVTTQIRQQKANVASTKADLKQSETSKTALYESAKALVEDAQNKIDNAKALVANANAALKSAQANYSNATAKYERIQELSKQGFVSTQAVEDAKTTVSVQQAAVETAEGQVQAATASLNSTVTQKRNAEQQSEITRAKADADLEAAQAKLAQADAALDYAQANTKQSSAYRQSLEALRAGVEAAQASLDSSIAKTEDAVLHSPIDGVVTARNLDPGALASPNQPILTVQAMNKVWVAVAVPEDVCVRLQVNQPVQVVFDSLGQKPFPARIAQINPSADPDSRQFMVRAILDNKAKKFSAGMFARVSFVTGRAQHVVAVPREAVQQGKDGGSYVIVAGKDRKAEFKPVIVGASDTTWIAVTSGLDASAKVVTMSASPVRDGQKLSTGKKRGGPHGGMHGAPGGKPVDNQPVTSSAQTTPGIK